MVQYWLDVNRLILQIPQCIRDMSHNMHCSVKNGALWDIGLSNCGICDPMKHTHWHLNQNSNFNKTHMKKLSAECPPFCSGLNMLIFWGLLIFSNHDNIRSLCFKWYRGAVKNCPSLIKYRKNKLVIWEYMQNSGYCILHTTDAHRPWNHSWFGTFYFNNSLRQMYYDIKAVNMTTLSPEVLTTVSTMSLCSACSVFDNPNCTFADTEAVNIDGLVQERCNSSTLAMESCLSCTNWYDLSILILYITLANYHDYTCKFSTTATKWMDGWMEPSNDRYVQVKSLPCDPVW